jgi:general secretion pathway protein D
VIKLFIAIFLISASLHAKKGDCSFKLFSIHNVKGVTLSEYIYELSESCSYTVIVADEEAKKRLTTTTLHQVHMEDFPIEDVLNTLIREHNLDYTLQKNILKISYLTTKTYHIDYIISERSGKSSTTVSLNSGSGSQTTQTTTSTTQQAGSTGTSQSGMEIASEDSFGFWNNLSMELQRIMNRPEFKYIGEAPIINKEAGLVTITATPKQINRLDRYIEKLNKKLKNQVLIDVHIFEVTLKNEHTTGIDWRQLYALQNFKVLSKSLIKQDVGSLTESADNLVFSAFDDLGTTKHAALSIAGSASINEVIKFLNDFGKVKTVSNPKILTLNNQPALISVGEEIFYKITQSATTGTTGGQTTTQNDIVNSVFAGILLDITPEISDNNIITLKINPSISDVSTVATSSGVRSIPPDLSRKQLSSVIMTKNGNRVVLGGLISSKKSKSANKVPLLGDIPLFGQAFRYEQDISETKELVIIITPRIINVNKRISLDNLGYTSHHD